MSQYAIKHFAQAFEAIPRILSENAGLNATEAVSKLYSETKLEGAPTHGVNINVSGYSEH